MDSSKYQDIYRTEFTAGQATRHFCRVAVVNRSPVVEIDSIKVCIRSIEPNPDQFDGTGGLELVQTGRGDTWTPASRESLGGGGHAYFDVAMIDDLKDIYSLHLQHWVKLPTAMDRSIYEIEIEATGKGVPVERKRFRLEAAPPKSKSQFDGILRITAIDNHRNFPLGR